ncbi:MAG: RsmB/NOP family class I SAM-dependent RNA methyltransferase [Candidatus Diapherotrites archaeon]|nr:RsmB/NOP family class I SAM-dependent RNA methyltransferase [Candidatus Diapherotrites archaeon]
MRKTFFPPQFIEKYKKFCGSEWGGFFECIQRKQPKAFWVNTDRATVEEVKKSLTAQKIKFGQLPFHEQAFAIELQRPGNLREFKEGKISIQEKAAMLPVLALAPTKKDYVLDACAAPGVKTIQLSNFAGKVLAVDVNSTRIKSLLYNKKVFGLKNVEVARSDARNVKETFDKILLDAPCSSEGLVRKRMDALEGWSQKLVQRKAKVQKGLILGAFDLLKPKGEMVYATCSFAPEENEEVVKLLLDKRKNAEVLPVEFKGVKIRENNLCKNCIRLWPQDNDTQQFFFAKIRKN